MAFAPGGTATVEFELDDDAFRFFHPEGGRTVEPGEFEVLVVNTSRDVRLRDAVEVAVPSANSGNDRLGAAPGDD